jgi:tetratricopeptide (TPR) repeat protein
MELLRASQLTTILAAAAALGALWISLPVRLATTSADSSIADCLTLANTPSTDLSALERCHTLVPRDVELTADLAAAYATAQRRDEAIKAYREIIAIDPLYADVRLRLARLLRESGDEAAAQSEIDAALSVQPNRKALIDFRGLKP